MPVFTRENAAIIGRKGALARWSRPPAPPAPDPQPAIPATVAEPLPDPFSLNRLLRVRAHLERLDDMSTKEKDPKRIKELAEASARYSEQERLLAGRPLPGSHKPMAPRVSSQSRSTAYEPILALPHSNMVIEQPASPPAPASSMLKESLAPAGPVPTSPRGSPGISATQVPSLPPTGTSGENLVTMPVVVPPSTSGQIPVSLPGGVPSGASGEIPIALPGGVVTFGGIVISPVGPAAKGPPIGDGGLEDGAGI